MSSSSEGFAHVMDDGYLKTLSVGRPDAAKVNFGAVPAIPPVRTDWVHRWMDRARQLASWSKDPSTKVGCVLVLDQHAIAEGYNGFPHGADDSTTLYLDRPMKYERTVHAEANAVAHAARFGQRTFGALAFVTFPTCPPCAGLLIQAGISGLVVQMPACEYCRNRARLLGAGRDTRISDRYQPAGEHQHIHTIATPGGAESANCGMPNSPAWGERFAISQRLMQEAGVPVTLL